MKQILLVEDCAENKVIIENALCPLANIHWVSTYKDALKHVNEREDYDMYILDVELPDGDGISLCQKILEIKPTANIVFISGHDTVAQKVLGFSAGGDDYITKPFEPLVLRAKIESCFRKMDLREEECSVLKWKELQIDTLKQEVKVFYKDNWYQTQLTALEFKILMYLASRVSHAINRDDILKEIWGENIHVYPRSVDTHISKIRKKLKYAPNLIVSVHGTGYKFEPTPSPELV